MTLEEVKAYVIANRKPLIIGALAAMVVRAIIR